jgi:hypothetical protein
MIAALLQVGIQYAPGSNAPVVSGSYSVVQNKALGAQVQMRVRIHLMNQGSSDLSVQRMTLWNFSHPDQGGSRACALMLRAHGSADITQEFIVSRSDYQRWQKGFRPRFVLEMAGQGNAVSRPTAKSTVVVRLDHKSGQEGK